jgi:hypothetical protein
VPAPADRQGIGWSIPLMNSNIYYFVLKPSIHRWHPGFASGQLAARCIPHLFMPVKLILIHRHAYEVTKFRCS